MMPRKIIWKDETNSKTTIMLVQPDRVTRSVTLAMTTNIPYRKAIRPSTIPMKEMVRIGKNEKETKESMNNFIFSCAVHLDLPISLFRRT